MALSFAISGVYPAKCPCINILIQSFFFKGRKQDLRGEQSSWGGGLFYRSYLISQIPLSFEGIGFVDIGLTRLLRVGLLIETIKVAHTFHFFE